MYHARHVLIPLTLRHTILRARAYNPVSFRDFSVTPTPPPASIENNEEVFIAKFKNTSMYNKLVNKPEALTAIMALAKVLQKSGFENMSQKPTSMQMIRLAANKEFRTAVQRVVTEMQNAGVDSAEAMQEIMSMQKGDSERDR